MKSVVWVSVGVDLAGSQKRRTGLCRMSMNLYSETCVKKSDEDILSFILSSDPEIVAVDAPLSMPKDREYFRICDKKLLEMGIRIIPPRFKSMKMLTERAIILKKKLEEHGFEVIEVYPSAAQDILKIPRRSEGIDSLREGLMKIGVKGFRSDECIHELDAVTCALTGIAYLRNCYIAVGDPSECIVILPTYDIIEKSRVGIHSPNHQISRKEKND
ncbi:MAG: DUF429 domain-containing protein [Aigarchaeota archaeon]|nr:DUF429 domain-containing protein [Aigarchaeota archaeon]MCX8192990.1 DUF429 domain-containing protein [Nitrososphaeria archaeon]MDW7986274.1 DUF429 domain-containing protein [Nitrososphaerota archaeon]